MQRFVMTGLFCLACAGTASAQMQAPRTAVEFYNTDANRFFISADTVEVQMLDDGMMSGWQRTGQVFSVLDADDVQSMAASPVCRLYSNIPGYDNLHFLSASPSECNAALATGVWIAESLNAFGAFMPDAMTGFCGSGTRPLYRSFDPETGDHRYTVEEKVQEQMIAQGRVAEGYGTFPVAMCVLQ